MVEAGAQEVPEDVILQALDLGQVTNGQIVSLIDEMVEAVGQPKVAVVAPAKPSQEGRPALSRSLARSMDAPRH